MKSLNALALLRTGIALLIVWITVTVTGILFHKQQELYQQRDMVLTSLKDSDEKKQDAETALLLRLESEQNARIVMFSSIYGLVLVASIYALAYLFKSRVHEADRTRVQLAVTQALVEETDFQDAAQRLLASIGELYDFAFGAVWLIDDHKPIIRPYAIWSSEKLTNKSFPKKTLTTVFKKGVGLPGRVWQTGATAWIDDVVVDPNFPRAAAAIDSGLHAAFAFPIIRDRQVVGIVEFYFPHILAHQRNLSDLLSPFGQEIGQYMERLEFKARLVEEARISKFAAHVGKALGSGSSLEDMLRECSELAVEHLEARYAAAWIPSEDVGYFELSGNCGDDSSLPNMTKLFIDEPTRKLFKRSCGKFALNGHILQKIANKAAQTDCPQVPLMVEPLLVRDELVGLIAVLPKKIFSVASLPSLWLASQNIALGISRSQMESRLEASSRLFTEITNNLEEMIWVTQPGGFGLKWVSPAFANFFNCSQDDLIREPMRALEGIDENTQEAVFAFFQSCACKGDSIEYRQMDASGKWHWLWCRSYPTFDRDGARAEVYGIATEITAKKEREKQVQEFYSMVSHELRTPLTSVHASLRIMEAGMAGPLSDKVSRLVNIARSESDRLIRLINDILDIRKLEAGMLELKMSELDVTAVVESSLAEMKGMAEDAGVELVAQYDWTGTIVADQDRTTQMLDNLLSNAIKFSGSGSQVRVKVAFVNGFVRFSVQDFGPGIAQSQLGKLFGKFQQLDSTDARPKGGSGLGLAITKAIAEQHGGHAGVSSQVGEGSTFWIDLPLAAFCKPKNAPTQIEQNSMGGRVLLVSCNSEFADRLATDLRPHAFDVSILNSFKDAEKTAKAFKPSAILLDLEGLEKDGLNWIQQHEADEQWPKTVVLAECTTYMKHARNTRATAWHCKPVSFAHMCGALGFAVAASRNYQEISLTRVGPCETSTAAI